MQSAAWIVFWAVLGILIAIQAIAYIVWNIALKSPKKGQGDDHSLMDDDQIKPLAKRIHHLIDTLNAVPYEPVFVQSSDGLRLKGRYYHKQDGAPVVICCHGYRGTPSRDFSGAAVYYREKGLNLLLIEERAHLGSEGRSITMGVRERYDVLTWIGYLTDRFGKDTKIVLTGISMGAATVLMVSGMNPPPNVRAVIADAPFTVPKTILQNGIKNMRLPPRLIYPFLWLGAWLFGGFNLSDPTANTAKAVTRSTVPILLIHGEADRIVPCEMGREIAAANPERVELHTFPDAGHGLSYLVDTPRYQAILDGFLSRVLA